MDGSGKTLFGGDKETVIERGGRGGRGHNITGGAKGMLRWRGREELTVSETVERREGFTVFAGKAEGVTEGSDRRGREETGGGGK